MKILITGGLGFIGSHLAEYLIKKNHQVVIFTKSLKKYKNIKLIENSIKIEKVDISNFKRLEKLVKKYNPSAIVHLAGETSHSKSFENSFENIDSNIKSTLCLLEVIRKNELKCQLILGSTFVVVGKPLSLPIDENSSCNPTTLYGANRLTSEHYCKIYHDVYGIKTKIFRVTNSYGPREQIVPNKNAINYLIHRGFNGELITLYNEGKFFRDLIYISDVVEGIYKILTKGSFGELYWISSGKKTWFYQLGNLLEKHTYGKIKYIKSPNYTKKVDVGNFIVRNAKLKKLGWKQKISLEEGIKLTLNSFK
jgi:UDP-glucose 4-epimerase